MKSRSQRNHNKDLKRRKKLQSRKDAVSNILLPQFRDFHNKMILEEHPHRPGVIIARDMTLIDALEAQDYYLKQKNNGV